MQESDTLETESALLKVKNDIHNSLAKGECFALTQLDLSAAFETVSRQILLHRLTECFGIQHTRIKMVHLLPNPTHTIG